VKQLEHPRVQPGSFRREYHARVEEALSWVEPTRSRVRERDLARMPAPVAAYVRWSGAVGKPRVVAFRAQFHGRIRAGADEPWMSFTGEQVNTYGDHVARMFHLHAHRSGLPVDVLHTFVGAEARMRVKLLSVVPMVDARGPELARAETVTLFNDLVVMAPAALVGADVRWEQLDALRVRGWFRNAGVTVSADLTFDESHRLIDFVSNDRLRASADGRTFTQQTWSTPLGGYREIEGRRLATYGEARWHAPAPEGKFTYLELDVEGVEYDPRPGGPSDRTGRHHTRLPRPRHGEHGRAGSQAGVSHQGEL
jgi:hypothetical protein